MCNKDELIGRTEKITYREFSCYTRACQPVAEDEMGCGCGMHGEDDNWMQGYGGQVWRQETRRETINRGILMNWNWGGRMD